MNPSSRSPRLTVAARKILRRRKPAKRRAHKFSAADRRDCDGLRKALARLNDGMTDRHPDWISHKTLAAFAAPHGGAAHRQQWYDYCNAKRRIPEIDKLIATVFFARYKVQELFPSWGFPQLTPFAPAVSIPRFLHGFLALAPPEQQPLTRVNELLLAATQEQCDAIIRCAHEVLGAPSPK